MLDAISPAVAWLTGALVMLASAASALHALFRKRSPRTAAVWVGLCLLLPPFGVLAYWIAGQNRIYYRARRMRRRWPSRPALDADVTASRGDLQTVARDAVELEQLMQIQRVGDAATGMPLLLGNRLQLLENGDVCYPRMLAAIGSARESVYIETYLLDGERTTEAFGAALEAAIERGVDVRVLIDGLGALIDFGRTRRRLRARGIRVETFLSPSLTGRGMHLNLRNHRKILTVDGEIGFTGGMNLRDSHDMAGPPSEWRARDLHFELHGPIVSNLENVFLEDWCFATGESLVGRAARCQVPAGRALCRAIPDGPNEDSEALKWILVGAIGSARRRVQIMVPYFIPTSDLETALVAASLRGIEIHVLMPATVDHLVTRWASRAMLQPLIRRGVEVRLQEGDFVHSKLVLIDEGTALVGSANLDPRSLNLNFEFNLLVHDPDLVAELGQVFERDWVGATPLTTAGLRAQPLWKRTRDHIARLAAPYL